MHVDSLSFEGVSYKHRQSLAKPRRSNTNPLLLMVLWMALGDKYCRNVTTWKGKYFLSAALMIDFITTYWHLRIATIKDNKISHSNGSWIFHRRRIRRIFKSQCKLNPSKRIYCQTNHFLAHSSPISVWRVNPLISAINSPLPSLSIRCSVPAYCYLQMLLDYWVPMVVLLLVVLTLKRKEEGKEAN